MSDSENHGGAEACIHDMDCIFKYMDHLIPFPVQPDWLPKSVRQVKEDLLSQSAFGIVNQSPQELSLYMKDELMEDHRLFSYYYNDLSDTAVQFELRPTATLE